MKRTAVIAALSGVLGLAVAGSATGAEVYLVARPFTKSLPPLPGPLPVSVPMWGFALCTNGEGGLTCGEPSVPGPQITAAAGDTLTIHLANDLAVPLSLVIPGQGGGGSPVMSGDRVRSFAAEVGPGATLDYTFASLRPGTYLYQTGTQPAIQVPMGLYGALVVTGGGYPGVAYETETVVFYSEIDGVQNAAVDAAVTADPLAPAYPSTVDYDPQYFLVNGSPYDPAGPAGPTIVGPGTATQAMLLRLVNAGLRSHAATIVGLDMTLVGEDGNLYPGGRRQSSTLLPAGKTLDAIVALPAGDRTYPVYDRMLDLTNANEPGGGLLAYLQTGSGSPPAPPTPAGADDQYSLNEDGQLIRGVDNGVLSNDPPGATDAQVVDGPEHGTLTLNADGSFRYDPDPDYSGVDTFTYSARVGLATIGATVRVTVSFVNDRPLAVADGPFTNNVNVAGQPAISVPAPGVLGNDVDPDGDTLTAVPVGNLPAGLTLNPDGSFSYSGPAGTRTFRYRASDGSQQSANFVTVTLRVAPANGPALIVRGPSNEIVSDYRWVLEEDRGYHPDPAGNPPEETLGINFHRSHMPVVAQGCVGASCAAPVPLTRAVIDRSRHYFVSVLPANAGTETGYTLGAAPIAPGATSVTVRVNQAPVPTAQIHVLVFEDNSPTNGAPDGNEAGLPGFQIILEDGAGRYGAAAGAMMFDAFGNPVRNSKDCGPDAPTPPANVILTCPDGTALIQNLPPGKYGVSVVPPAGTGVKWQQTSTIEGKRVIDAWVKAAEPAFFQEFGPPGYHVFVGFVSPDRLPPTSGGNTVSGRVTNLHMSRPPDQTLWDSDSRDALAHTTAWVGLNSAGGIGPTIAAGPADGEGNFELGSIPDGTYQLVVWDEFLDQIIAFRNVCVPQGPGCEGGSLGNVPVFQWFARMENHVFLDANENGVRDAGEEGMPEQNVNQRFRDGSIYQGAPTDGEGFVPFDETFPFFHWLVEEVDFTRHKATGVTVTVDAGGDVAASGGVLRPQVGSPRSETGPVLTQAFQGFLGQTSVVEWGKKPYASGENGGISGIVYYATTRAEDDPRLNVGDLWEPGVPNVTVRLYREVTRADGTTGLVFVDEATTDSWDASLPSDCPGADPGDAAFLPGANLMHCYDGLRNFNQVRPGVFDGGYAFTEDPARPGQPLRPGRYVVEAIPPPGYEIVKEEDKNIDFGDVFAGAAAVVMLPNMGMVEVMPAMAFVAAATAPEPGLTQPACVGPTHTVPAFLSLFPGQGIEAPFAFADRPLCNRKSVLLNDRANAVADFHLFTAAPIAGHGVGMILDDTAQEFNPASPQFGEKWAPPYVPVSFRDWTGREVSRVYSDQWGRFNALVPSTFSANEPMFSGMSPSMMISCMNDPGPIPGPGGASVTDPQYNPVYGTFCYTLQYMPGTTTYLDTPVVPTAAFAAGNPPVDCAYPNGTPMIRQVNGTGVGPWVSGTGSTLTILAQGPTDVPNPTYEGPQGAAPKTIQRDYGFGTTPGSVTVGGIPLANVSWNAGQITGTVPAAASGGGQLVVTRGDNGRHTLTAVTVHVGGQAPLRVTPATANVQGVLDGAAPGRLVMFGPGTYDRQLFIVTRPLRLQGAGPGSTLINAAKVPMTKLESWRATLDALLPRVDLLPSQLLGAGGVEPDTLNTEQGAGITVLGRSRCDGVTPDPSCFVNGRQARIDGFTITGGDSAGALYVNGWVHGLEISNNIVKGNSGLYHGGVRVGVPFLEDPGTPATGGFGFNRDLRIHHNQITHNGGLGGAGGGVLLCTGTDGYRVTENWVCGNFTMGHGAGIAHFGLSRGGTIARNKILFNQSFNQGVNVHGGGLLVAGEPPVGAGTTLGAGDVNVDANLLLGNQAGAGHGGGIRTQFVDASTASPSRVRITNNMVVNNVAGWAGGGISLQDTLGAEIVNNTVARNDSTATVGAAFVSPSLSAIQPAGVVSEPHSPSLGPGFSTPIAFHNNIIWENRSFHYMVNGEGVGSLQPPLTATTPGACDTNAVYWDVGVIGGGALTPTSSILTGAASPFVSTYCNGARSTGLIAEVTTLQAAPALDEGGNWIDVRFGPITLTRTDGSFFGDYHIQAGSSAVNAGFSTLPAPTLDYDYGSRTGTPDVGADEQGQPASPVLP